MSGSEWAPVHHETVDDPEPDAKPAAAKPKAKPKDDTQSEPAIIMTFPPHMIAGIWSLSEALKEATEAVRELIEELRTARKE
jgi:hypothetical protein